MLQSEPLPDDDDAIAAAIAARVIHEHPTADTRLRRTLVRAYAKAALQEPMTLEEVAAIQRTSPQRISEIEAAARTRMKHAYLKHYPKLCP